MPCTMSMVLDNLPQFPHNHSPLPSLATDLPEYRRESSFPSSNPTKRPTLGPSRRYTFPLPSACFSPSPKPSVKAPSTTTPPCSSLMLEAFPFPSHSHSHVPSSSMLSSSSSSSPSSSNTSSSSVSSAFPTETTRALLTATSSFHSSTKVQEITGAETSTTVASPSSSAFVTSSPSTAVASSVATIAHSPVSTPTSTSTTSTSTPNLTQHHSSNSNAIPSPKDTVAQIQTLAPLQTLDTTQDSCDQVAVTHPPKNQEGGKGKAQTSSLSSRSSHSSSCAATRTDIIYRSAPLDQLVSAFASLSPPPSTPSSSTLTPTATPTLEHSHPHPHPRHSHDNNSSSSSNNSHNINNNNDRSSITTQLAPRTSSPDSRSPHHPAQPRTSPPPPPSLPPFRSLLGPPPPSLPSSLESDYLSHVRHPHRNTPHLGSHPMSSVTLSYSQHHSIVNVMSANQAQHTDMAALALSQHHYQRQNRSPLARSPSATQDNHEGVNNSNGEPSLVQTPRPTPTSSTSCSSVVIHQGSSKTQPPTPPPHFFPGPSRESDPQQTRQGLGQAQGQAQAQAHQHSSEFPSPPSAPASSSPLLPTSSSQYAPASSTTTFPTTTITSSSSSSSLSSRTPVRYRLADPRVRQFIPSKSPMLTASSTLSHPPTQSRPTSTNPTFPSDPTFSKTGPRQDLRYTTAAGSHSTSSLTFDPHPRRSPGRHDQPHTLAANALASLSAASHDSPRRPSYDEDRRSTQSPLPSPVPSMTSLSPDLHARHHPYHKYPHYSQHQRAYYPQPDLSSPASEADLALDSKSSMGPLFHSSPSPSSHRSSWTATSPHQHQRSHGPGATESDYPPTRRFTPPPISTAWSAKHHHHSIPMRSPVRQHGQELMTTSAVDTAPSEYMKMDYYDIYLQNPKLLRPEGGRNEAQGRYGSQRPRGTEPYEEPRSYSTWSTAASRAKGRTPGYSDVIDSLAISSQERKIKRPIPPSSSSLSRTQPMAIRNLLADDDHEDPSHRQSSLESYSYHDGRSSRLDSDTEISESGSMRVWKEEDGEYVDRPYQYMGSSSVMKRKQTSHPSDLITAPKKKRKSKKQAMAEAAAAAAAGIVLPEDEPKKRKRTKKIQDPDHVSPAGFRHGGERVVQVPDELVVLEPDVGPVHMLDVESPPMVLWRGQPLSVVGKPGYDQLHPHEARIASTLRLSPAQYLSCKKTLILASRQFYAVKGGKQFRKSDAQKLCRIDVNKTSQLWEVFARIGWLEGLSAKDI